MLPRSRRAIRRIRHRSCRRSARAIWPRSPRPCAATRSMRSNSRALRASGSSWRSDATHAGGGVQDDASKDGAHLGKLAADRDARLDARSKKLLDDVAADAVGVCRRRIRGQDSRPRGPHHADAARSCPAAGSARSRCRSTKITASCCAGCCSKTFPAVFRTPAACSRSSARTRIRRACSPAKAIRSAPTRASSCCREGHAGQAAVDRVRQRDAVRQRSGRAAGHLRQGRQLRRQHRHARRHEGAVRRLRPDRTQHVGVR